MLSFNMFSDKCLSKLLRPSTFCNITVMCLFDRHERCELEEEVWVTYASGTLLNREWTRAGYELWHTVMRIAVRGICHKVCQVKVFHVLIDNVYVPLQKWV